MKYIVYQTQNLINGKIYIGQHKTKNPEIFDQYLGCGVRVNSPSSYMNPKAPLQFAVKKYGVKNFKRSTLKICDTLKEALDLEAVLVDYKFIKRTDTYNAQLGGLTGYKYHPINQFDSQGNFIKTWESMAIAAEFYNVSHNAIMQALKCKGSCKGFFWAKQTAINIEEYTFTTPTKCFQYDGESLKLITAFNSIKEAACLLQITPQAISTAIRTGFKTKGFYFSNKIMETYKIQKKCSVKHQKLYVYNLEGEFITELVGSKDIYKFFNITKVTPITTAIRKGGIYKNYQISLEFKESLPKYVRNTWYSRPIEVYDLTGTLIEVLPTKTMAIKKYTAGVKKVLDGIQQQCKGYIFKYEK